MKQLERFHQRALRSILGIRWQDKVTNTEVFDRSTCISNETMLLKSCLRWTGHMIRMEDHRLPKQLLQGHRKQGRPCKRFKDTVKVGMKRCNIPPTAAGRYCSGQTTLARAYTICVIFTKGTASPPSTVRQRTPPLSSLYPSDNCKLPAPSLCTALQVQDRPAEPLPYPQTEAQTMLSSRPRDHHDDDSGWYPARSLPSLVHC